MKTIGVLGLCDNCLRRSTNPNLVQRHLLAVCLILACLLNAATPRADEFHYNNMIIGERAAGMGGAFAALADDTSGMYYNPAGIVQA